VSVTWEAWKLGNPNIPPKINSFFIGIGKLVIKGNAQFIHSENVHRTFRSQECKLLYLVKLDAEAQKIHSAS
jgi:hypothetical protein